MNPNVADLLKKIFVGLCIIITLVLAVKVYEYISQRYFNIEGFEDIKSIVTREYTNRYVNDSPIWSNKFYNMQFDDDLKKMQPPISFWKPDIKTLSTQNSQTFKMTGNAISNDTSYKSPKVKTLVVDGDLKLPDDFKKVGEISGVSGDIDWTDTDQFNILNDMQNSFNSIDDINKFNDLYNSIYKNYENVKNLYQTYNEVISNSMNNIVLTSLKFIAMQYDVYGYTPTQPTGTNNYFSMQELKNESEIKSSEPKNGNGYVSMFIPFGVDVELYNNANYKGDNYRIVSPDNPTERNEKFDETKILSDYKQLGDFVAMNGLNANGKIAVCYPVPEKYDNFYSISGNKAADNAKISTYVNSTSFYKNNNINTHIVAVKDSVYTHCVTFDIKLKYILESAGEAYKLENLEEFKTLEKNREILGKIIGIYNLNRQRDLKKLLDNISNYMQNTTVRYQHYYLLPALFTNSKIDPTISFIVKPNEAFFDNIKKSIANELNNTNPLTYGIEKPKLFDINYNSTGSDKLKLLIKPANYTYNNNFVISTDSLYATNKTFIEAREKEFEIFNKIIKSISTNTLGLPPLFVYTPIAPKNYKAIGDIVISKLSNQTSKNDELIKMRTNKEYMCVPEHCVVPVRPWRTTDLFYEINASTSDNQSNYLGFYMNPYTGTFKVSNLPGVLPTGSVEKVVACVKKCKVIDNLIRSNDCIAKTAKNNKILLNETPVVDTSSADAEAEYYESKIAEQSEVIKDLKLRANNIRVNNDKYDIINKSENRAKLQNYVDTQKENIDIITQKLLGSAGRVDVNIRIPADLRIKVTNSIVKLINDSPNMSKSQKQNLINQALNISDSNDVQQILNRCPTYDLDDYVKKSVVNDVCYGCELE